MFCDVLVRKNAFLDYKNKEFKMAKNWHFANGLVVVFLINLKIFHPFIRSKIVKKKRVSRYLRKEKVFLDYKIKEFKKSENWHFFKGVSPWFW